MEVIPIEPFGGLFGPLRSLYPSKRDFETSFGLDAKKVPGLEITTGHDGAISWKRSNAYLQ